MESSLEYWFTSRYVEIETPETRLHFCWIRELSTQRHTKHPDIKFDALVYHHNDEARFVEERLRPRLEEDPNNFRLFLPLLRDFRLGVKAEQSPRIVGQ